MDLRYRAQRERIWHNLKMQASRTPSPKITDEDIEEGCKYLRRDGAPGADELPGWIYLRLSNTARLLSKVLEVVTHAGIAPQLWKKLLMAPIFKREDRLDGTKYRPVILMSILAKAVEASMKRHLAVNCPKQEIWHPAIMGFTKGKGTHTALFVLLETVAFRHYDFELREHQSKHHCTTFVIIADKADAFDGMDPTEANLAFHAAGGRGKFLLLNADLKNNQSVVVRYNGHLSRSFQRTSGRAQGDLYTPLEHNGIDSGLHTSLENNNLGIFVGANTDGLLITSVAYADDSASLASSSDMVSRQLSQRGSFAAKVGDRYKQGEVSVLEIGKQGTSTGTWHMGSLTVGRQDSCEFLGRIIGSRLHDAKGQLEHILTKALKGKHLLAWAGCFTSPTTLDLTLALYSATIKQVLNHGLALCTLSTAQRKKVTGILGGILRQWAHVSNRVRTTAILAETGAINPDTDLDTAVVKLIERMKLPESGRYANTVLKARLLQLKAGETGGVVGNAFMILQRWGHPHSIFAGAEQLTTARKREITGWGLAFEQKRW